MAIRILILNDDARPGHNIQVQEVYSNGQDRAGDSDVVGPGAHLATELKGDNELRIRLLIPLEYRS